MLIKQCDLCGVTENGNRVVTTILSPSAIVEVTTDEGSWRLLGNGSGEYCNACRLSLSDGLASLIKARKNQSSYKTVPDV